MRILRFKERNNFPETKQPVNEKNWGSVLGLPVFQAISTCADATVAGAQRKIGSYKQPKPTGDGGAEWLVNSGALISMVIGEDLRSPKQ